MNKKTPVTQKDIARMLNVSQMTISRVRNNLPGVGNGLRKKILKAMRQHDYVCDRSAARLRGAQAGVIGVIAPDITSSFFPNLIRGIQSAADAAGYLVLLGNSRESYKEEAQQIEKLREFKVDGLIIAPSGPPRHTKVYRRLLSANVPFVFLDRYKPTVPCSSVVSDTRGGAQMLGRHLAEKGYRHWGYLEGPPDVSSAKEHRDGLYAAFAEAGLTKKNLKRINAGFSEAGGYQAAIRLLADKCPDVIVAVNDAVAFGAYRLLRERGLKIPDDVALAGFSNLQGGELLPTPLTTVLEHTEDMGPKAFELLHKRMCDPKIRPEKIRLRTELVIRNST